MLHCCDRTERERDFIQYGGLGRQADPGEHVQGQLVCQLWRNFRYGPGECPGLVVRWPPWPFWVLGITTTSAWKASARRHTCGLTLRSRGKGRVPRLCFLPTLTISSPKQCSRTFSAVPCMHFCRLILMKLTKWNNRSRPPPLVIRRQVHQFRDYHLVFRLWRAATGSTSWTRPSTTSWSGTCANSCSGAERRRRRSRDARESPDCLEDGETTGQFCLVEQRHLIVSFSESPRLWASDRRPIVWATKKTLPFSTRLWIPKVHLKILGTPVQILDFSTEFLKYDLEAWCLLTAWLRRTLVFICFIFFRISFLKELEGRT